MDIQFLGAAQTVTGSKYFIRIKNTNILVDCGLFQGYKELRLRNWENFPVDPSTIDYVLLTHAHIDHSGYIPLLVKNGFRGKIYCSQATRDLCEILLRDCGHLQEKEALYANRQAYSKHHPALPLYTLQDAEQALNYFHPISFNVPFKLSDDLQFTLKYAGHILGASSIYIKHRNVSILFSGDLGRPNDPIMKPPQNIEAADYLVIESTYGNRLHETVDPEDQLVSIINRTVKRGGVILVPAFAVGRAQTLLFYIHRLKINNRIPNIPVFMDSPMAIDATKLFYLHNKELRLSPEQCADVCRVAKYIHTVEESIEIMTKKMPMIIISASGMASGGRILHHIKNFGPDYRNTILFAGFQAGGTRGDRMVRGEKEVKMLGQMVEIKAEVIQLDNLSAHADYQEMLSWLGHLKKVPRKVFITHGENGAAESLKTKIEEKYRWPCHIPTYLSREELT